MVLYGVHLETLAACSRVIQQAFHIIRRVRLLSMAPDIVVTTLLQLWSCQA